MPKVTTAIPGDESFNGLPKIADLLLSGVGRQIVIGVADCPKITVDTASGQQDATIRLLRLEAVAEEDTARAMAIVENAMLARLGPDVLPFEVRPDLSAWTGTPEDERPRDATGDTQDWDEDEDIQ